MTKSKFVFEKLEKDGILYAYFRVDDKSYFFILGDGNKSYALP